MEYAQNGSLLDVIRRDIYIDEGRGRRWLRQLVDAVDYCHERGVVHRDIKCENLLMDQDMNIKLSDFGFARGHMKPKNGIAQLSETFCGSYAYASPEILRGIPYQPQMSDVWSMGVVLYAMVYGRLPFDDTNYAQLLKQVQSKVTFPKEPKVSHTCRSLITRILTPQRMRLRTVHIKEDAWLAVSVATAQTSTDKSMVFYTFHPTYLNPKLYSTSIYIFQEHLPSILIKKGVKKVDQQSSSTAPTNLLTMEVLAAKPKTANVSTTDDESIIATEPRSSTTYIIENNYHNAKNRVQDNRKPSF
ncbi:testis-specific serine/threonine-protein kinase 2 isoform X2 [Orussus abietinus]|uniref:testis-specific serine/threonine-protein kinase 2 isoform X2 n=1 Tax=Orussus abietinus TaxID=222816 RepID=UPI0006263134|nr:testis-specific serine/threonine-protein kinase 2 isoform X2 [Orussus abietinus]